MSNMDSILYVYDTTKLSDLRKRLNNYKFYSIAYCFNKSDTLDNLYTMDLEQFEKSVIDLTNLVRDNNINKIFSERYILALCCSVEEIQFCINCDLIEKFAEQFPYLFDDEHIDYEFQKNTEREISEPESLSANIANALILNTYTNTEKIKECYKTGEIISLSNLIDECEGISFRYNIDNIRKTLESQNIKYVDISSVIRMFRLRQDLIFPFEILIQRILLNGNIQYCIEQSLVADATALFPFWIIVLIDEFEKATPSVYNFFYELLEDGIFTDRHGVEHNLNEYIIVFTSNMTQSEYSKKIPDSLKSRFDMVYYFVDLPIEEKQQYIQVTALRLIEKLEKNFGKQVNIQDISLELSELSQYNNLRNIKKAVEDRVFNAFLDIYVDGTIE